MDKEYRIGIIYNHKSNWVGGTYYIQNIVSCLNYISTDCKPAIVVFSESETDFKELQRATGYLKMEFIHFGPKRGVVRYIDAFYRKLTGKEQNLINIIDVKKYNVDIVYPFEVIVRQNQSIAWIPDLQEKHLPQLFSKSTIEARNHTYWYYIKNRMPIVFSSQDSLKDFRQYVSNDYPLTYVVPFAVSHPDFSQENIQELKIKYGIRENYLFCANQFWIHKNHKFLFEVMLEAKKRGLKLQLLCSGKFYDQRNPSYGQELQSFIKQNDLEDTIILLGFISREEQLCLMKNSYAIIQPSLFEGWNTTVEDAKCLNKFIFLSNLEVHKEQNPQNVCFFNPYSKEDLVNKLLTVKPTNYPYDYEENRKQCGVAFLKVIKDVVASKC